MPRQSAGSYRHFPKPCVRSAKGFAGLIDQVDAGRDFLGALLHRVNGSSRVVLDLADHIADFFRGFCRPFGEFPDFIGHYGKSPALFTSTSRFDRGV